MPGLLTVFMGFIDCVAIVFAMTVAIWLKFANSAPAYFSRLPYLVPVLPLGIAAYYVLGLYRQSARFISIRALLAILLAATAVALSKALAFALTGPLPFSLFVIDWMLTLLFLGLSRIAPRVLLNFAELSEVRTRLFAWSGQNVRRLVIAGAGSAGENVAREIRRNLNLPLHIVGFVDDDVSRHGQIIHDCRVLGSCDELPRIVAQYSVEEVFITIPSAAGAQIRRIAEICRTAGVCFKTLPPLEDLYANKMLGSQLREIAVEDLLLRPPAEIDIAGIASYIEEKTVMVTGAGGSFGRELCRQLLPFRPASIILLGRGENSIYDCVKILQRESALGNTLLLPVIADIRDSGRIGRIFSRYRPDIVFHAAGHKHIELMEENPEEMVKTNITGSRHLLTAAQAVKCSHFIMLSSGQAANPVSVLGAGKLVGEMLVESCAEGSVTCCIAVRFGNVLGSSGSVLPLLRQQVAQGGPVTITHPDMSRCFMTVTEVARLVLQAVTLGRSGAVYMLRTGEASKIVDLAEDLIRLSGFEPGRDIEIRFTGLRPGELSADDGAADLDGLEPLPGGMLYRVPARGHDRPAIQALITSLEAAANANDRPAVRRLLAELVPGFPAASNTAASGLSASGRRPALRLVGS